MYIVAEGYGGDVWPGLCSSVPFQVGCTMLYIVAGVAVRTIRGHLGVLHHFRCDVVAWDGVEGGHHLRVACWWCGINARTAPSPDALNPNPLLTDCWRLMIFLVKRRIILMIRGCDDDVGDLIGDDEGDNNGNSERLQQ